MNGGAILRANALEMPLADNSVDLIITSPPYFGLRSYRDGDEHYAGQVGSESTPQEFLAALWSATAEMKRVLKPSGSIFVNLGDKYVSTGGNTESGMTRSLRRVAKGYAAGTSHTRAGSGTGVRPKSLMGLPWRYAIGCMDELDLILRAEIIWDKPNGLPESVTDRVRRSHEQWFHMTKEPRYFSAVDEIREPYVSLSTGLAATFKRPRSSHDLVPGQGYRQHREDRADDVENGLGKLPASVWSIPTEPLLINQAILDHYKLPTHFAAFPQELPRRLILGWSPSAICTACGEGRRPVVSKEVAPRVQKDTNHLHERRPDAAPGTVNDGFGMTGDEWVDWQREHPATILGYVCACTPRTSHRGKRGDWKDGREVMVEHGSDDFHSPGNAVPRRPGGFGTKVPASQGEWEYHLDGWTPPPTRSAVVLDPFAGTGTTVGVARALGRFGIGLDLSFDYTRLATWRVFVSGNFSKSIKRTNEAAQGTLL